MTRLAGPLGQLVTYSRPDPKKPGSVAVGPGHGDHNGGLLFRRSAWIEVSERDRADAESRLLDQVVKAMSPNKLLKAAANRRRAAVARLARRHECRELVVRPVWKAVVGLGEETTFETGLRLHGTYGVPVLPGSSLKGVARAAAREDEPADYADYGAAAFGREPSGAGQMPSTGTASASTDGGPEDGRIIFLDALPEPSQNEPVVVDVMNPHVPGYYRDPAQTAPAEYHQPVPVQFLAMSRELSFSVHLVGRGSDEDFAALAVEYASAWLKTALMFHGLGAKTNAGYGYFETLPSRPGDWVVIEPDGSNPR